MLENNEVNYGVFVVLDNAIEKFGLPFVANNHGYALRTVVSSIIHLDDNVINDFELLEIGQYDVDTAKIEGYDEPICVANGKFILTEVIKARKELDDIRKQALEEYESLKQLKMEAK